MPVRVVKRGAVWITIDRKGKVHGQSKTKAKAAASARIINASVREKGKRK